MIGIAFEGCACRAAFHAGVAAAFAESKLAIGLTAGTSSGSLCAAALAAGRAADLPGLWRALADRSIISFRRAAWNRSLFDMSHLVRNALESALGAIDLRDRPVEALVVATRLRDWSPIVFSSRIEPTMLEPLLGSCFLPPFYGRAIRVRGDLLVDGGFIDNLPIERLAARGAHEIVAVVTSPRGTALKSLVCPSWVPKVDGTRVHVIHPARALEIGAWDFSGDRMNRAIDEGYRRVREFIGN
jgi:NTE family protein